MTTVTPKAASRRQKTPEVPKLHSVYRILAKVVLKMILVKALPSRPIKNRLISNSTGGSYVSKVEQNIIRQAGADFIYSSI